MKPAHSLALAWAGVMSIVMPAHAAVPAARQAMAATLGLAGNVLDDRQLADIRGGMEIGSGIIVSFSFQEATYINNNLTQNIIVPTLTVSPGSIASSVIGTVTGATGGVPASAISAISNAVSQAQTNSVATSVQAAINGGMTTIASTIGGNGVTNVINNAANGQLVQQTINANIGITGLTQALQSSVASTVLSRVQAASTQFR